MYGTLGWTNIDVENPWESHDHIYVTLPQSTPQEKIEKWDTWKLYNRHLESGGETFVAIFWVVCVVLG